MELGGICSPGTYMLFAPEAAPSEVTSHFWPGVPLLITVHCACTLLPASKLSTLSELICGTPFTTATVRVAVALPFTLETVQLTVVMPVLAKSMEALAAEGLFTEAPLLAAQA